MTTGYDAPTSVGTRSHECSSLTTGPASRPVSRDAIARGCARGEVWRPGHGKHAEIAGHHVPDSSVHPWVGDRPCRSPSRSSRTTAAGRIAHRSGGRREQRTCGATKVVGNEWLQRPRPGTRGFTRGTACVASCAAPTPIAGSRMVSGVGFGPSRSPAQSSPGIDRVDGHARRARESSLIWPALRPELPTA